MVFKLIEKRMRFPFERLKIFRWADRKMTIITIYLFCSGLVLGSFFNVVGLRLPLGKSLIYPSSSCPSCSSRLKVIELIPVISYIWQKGSCRVCKYKISALYPTIELSTAVLFSIAPFITNGFGEGLLYITLSSLLIMVIVSDLSYMVIPNSLLLFFLPILILEQWYFSLASFSHMAIGGILGYLVLLAILLLSRGGMGGGDVKLFGVIGLVLGIKGVFLSLFLAVLFGACGAVIGMIIGRVQKGKPFPFGPYIAFGTFIVYMKGDQLFSWYMGFFI